METITKNKTLLPEEDLKTLQSYFINTANSFLSKLLVNGRVEKIEIIGNNNCNAIKFTWECDDSNKEVLSLRGNLANEYINSKLSYHIKKYDELENCDTLTNIYTDEFLMKNLKSFMMLIHNGWYNFTLKGLINSVLDYTGSVYMDLCYED
jgi:hypothetical protein